MRSKSLKSVTLKRFARSSLSSPARRSSRRYFAADTDTPSGGCDATLTQGPEAEADRASFNHDQVLSRSVRARPAISRRQQDEGRASEGALLHDDFERALAVYAQGTRERHGITIFRIQNKLLR